jgi:hypothetical protein
VSNLLERYEQLLAVSLTDNRRIHEIVKQQKRAILAIDGMQPDVGHEVLWVIRECLSGEILLASLWPCVAIAYEWVHQAALILDNESGFDAHTVRRRFQGLIATMSRWKAKAGDLESGILHFLICDKKLLVRVISLLRCRRFA